MKIERILISELIFNRPLGPNPSYERYNKHKLYIIPFYNPVVLKNDSNRKLKFFNLTHNLSKVFIYPITICLPSFIRTPYIFRFNTVRPRFYKLSREGGF